MRFEDRWTALSALRMLRGEASSIWLERIDDAETGFEFELETTAGGVEHHQVKRQTVREGGWSLRGLAKVLTSFRGKLENPEAVCVFVSGSSVEGLEDLATDAANAPNWQVFRDGALQSERRKGVWTELRAIWGTEDEWTFGALRRVRVEIINEARLVELLAMTCELVLDGDADTAPAALVEILRDRTNQRVRPNLLWSDLAKMSLGPNPWKDHGALVACVRAVNHRFVRLREGSLIAGALVERREVRQLLARLEDDQVVLLEGGAGAGKSAVLMQLVGQLEQAGTPHLVFRLDGVTPTDSPDALGEHLNLPTSPAVALAAASGGERSVLIIDQLDAISSSSGRRAELLDCVAQIVRGAETQPQMRVVLACRSFDARHDARLRRFLAGRTEPIAVGPLPTEDVDRVLAGLGVDPAEVTPALRELLRLPLHLLIYSVLAASAQAPLPALSSLRELYDEFWRDRQREVASRLQAPPRWLEVMRAMVDDLNANARLFARAEILDAWELDREAMLSAGVLVEDQRQVSFFHETFFDYAFARLFFGSGETVRDLLSVDQLLFRRAQVRQLLAYEREADRDRYLADLRFLLQDDGVRFHIRDLVLTWLGALPDPTESEWTILCELQGSSQPALARRARDAVVSAAWFATLDDLGVIERWLSDPGRAALALAVIRAAASTHPRRAAELLEPHGRSDPEAAQAVMAVLNRGSLAAGREIFELFLNQLNEDVGPLDRLDFLFAARDLPEERPEWGCELVGAYLRNRMHAAEHAGVQNPFDWRGGVVPRELHVHELVVDSAKRAPAAFFEFVWPPMLELIERTAQDPNEDLLDDRLVQDAVWHGGRLSSGGDGMDDDLLEAAEAAARKLAVVMPDRFAALLNAHAHTRYETVCAVLFAGCAADAASFADGAGRFILADLRRLNVGRAFEDHWGTRELLAAITPHVSKELHRQLEQTVLGYATAWERSKHGLRDRGYAQFTLLDAMAPGRRSDAARRRLTEWQRKFGVAEPEPPSGVQGGIVGSPIPPEATRRMRDEHWLGAVARYRTMDSDRRDFLKGGAHQLSQELEARTKEDPVRFIGLAELMADDTHPYYFDAILRGVAGSEQQLQPDDAVRLLRRCHAVPGRPCGRWIAHPAQKLREQPLPPEAAQILEWYVRNDPDPAPVSEDFSGDISPQERLELQGLNSVRGSIAYELAPHVERHRENLDSLRPSIDVLASDPSAAVRAMAVRIALGMLHQDEEAAIEYFAALADHPDDRVLAGREAHAFLRFCTSRNLTALTPVLRRMITSQQTEVRTRGAAQAAIASLHEDGAGELVDLCWSGDPALRKGLASVFAANASHEPHRETCTSGLARLFDDTDAGVRQETTRVWREAADIDFEGHEELVLSFTGSAAFEAEGAGRLLHGLTTADAPPTHLVLTAVEAFLQAPFSQPDAASGGLAMHDAGELVARSYATTSGAERERALDAVDRLLALDTFRLSSTIEQYDRG